MSETDKSTIVVQTGIPTITITLVFMVLKLTGAIAWSWWWVMSPLWLPIALAFGAMGLVLAIVLVGMIGILAFLGLMLIVAAITEKNA
jgi:hypothetical protein